MIEKLSLNFVIWQVRGIPISNMYIFTDVLWGQSPEMLSYIYGRTAYITLQSGLYLYIFSYVQHICRYAYVKNAAAARTLLYHSGSLTYVEKICVLLYSSMSSTYCTATVKEKVQI